MFFFFSVKNNKYTDSMTDFTRPWNHSDQIITVEESDLHVHRCVLSLWSPVFDRMFNSGFKESTLERVKLHDKKHTEVREMLEIMYDRRKQVTGMPAYMCRLEDSSTDNHSTALYCFLQTAVSLHYCDRNFTKYKFRS